MKLKLDENGNVVVNDGKPVYEKEDGTEFIADVPDLHSKLTQTGRENRDLRKKNEELSTKVEEFSDIDPTEAKKALDTVKSLESGDLKNADEFNRRIEEMKSTYQQELEKERQQREEANQVLASERLSNAFNRSKFVQDKIAIPVDMIQATFGRNFKHEDGKLVAYDGNGNVIFSHNNPSEPAGFDEALERLVSHYPHKDSIIKGSGHSGGGNGTGRNSGGARIITRKEFESLSAAEKQSTANQIREGKVTIESDA